LVTFINWNKAGIMDLISLQHFCLVMTYVFSHKSVYLNLGDFKIAALKV